MRGRAAVLALVLVALCGCARKAPSPEQCVSFTELLIGVPHERLLEYPAAKADFDAVVTACLTTPFDQRVFACVAESRSPVTCLKQYMPELMRSNDVGGIGSRRPRGPGSR